MSDVGGSGTVEGRSRISSDHRELVVRTLWVVTDCACWVMALLITLIMRLEFDPLALTQPLAWTLGLVAAAVHGVVGLWVGPYLVRHVRGSFDEVTSVVRAAVLTGLILAASAWFMGGDLIPRSVPLLATALAVVLMLAARFTIRSYCARRAAMRCRERRVIVYGAGIAGRRLVYNMLHDERSDLVPVAFIDDDRAKRRLKVEGVPVLGSRADLTAVAAARRATDLVIAMPAADPGTIREIRRLADGADLSVKVLPPLNDWIRHDQPQVGDLRDLDLADLLGRREVHLDQRSIRDHLAGKVVLVTGAGGSIGSELCRQIASFSPGRLVMLDRDESALHGLQLSMTGRGLLEGEDLVLVNIRDAEALRRHLEAIRPDVVFHAAALKHLSLLERFPAEAWATNVVGTLNVLSAAAAVGVGTFVNISTDKAANPISTLGRSKRLGERLTAHFARFEPGTYVSVRFGNVLGSRGSVIPAFTEQIRRGGPVTVTHPDVERYFMLIPEACQLVLQAGALGGDGRAMVLDMGQPVKIADVARYLIGLHGGDVQVEFSGLRPGEKLTEALIAGDELSLPTAHPMIAAVEIPPLAPAELPLVERLPGGAAAALDACVHLQSRVHATDAS